QISLLAGADFWRTVALPQHGIPSLKTTDGPSGARGEFFKNGTPAALFPCGASLAATFDASLIARIGAALGEETRARGADILLAPTVCLHRSPLGGRNFESFSEDPVLTGVCATAYVKGVQGTGVAATVKHFVANEQETGRMGVDSVVGERALRELYLKPFEMVVRDAGPWALMSAYNKVNGVQADMCEFTLVDVLRNEWGFDGLVMSDWTGTNSVAESITARCALEMPGPTKWRGERALSAIHSGALTAQAVDAAALDLLRLVQRTRGFHGANAVPPTPKERADDKASTRALIREAGVAGLTLLKNEGAVLPVCHGEPGPAGRKTKVAVIGPNARRAVAGGGGSASLNPYYLVSPWEGLEAQAADAGIELVYAQGCDTAKWLPLAGPVCSVRDESDGAAVQGVTLEYYYGDGFEGAPAAVQHKSTTDLFLWDSAPAAVLPAYSFRVRTTLTPRSTGRHSVSFSSVGPGRLFLDGELFIDNWDWTDEGEAMFEASEDVVKTVQLEANRPVAVLIESTNAIRPASKLKPGGPTHAYGGARLGYHEESGADLLAEAVAAAQAADTALVFAGLDAEWESEGYDRQTLALPKNGSQDALIAAVAAANPATVVVNQSGSPVAMPWIDAVPAVLQAWYQGQEAGHALADVLLGRHSPGGRLPTTFPRALAHTPAHANWGATEDERVVYAEGLGVGYRHFDAPGAEAPLFAFGHGLAYAEFEYEELRVSSPASPHTSSSSSSYSPSSSSSTTPPLPLLTPTTPLTLTQQITNTSSVTAPEIIQAYIHTPDSRVPRPVKELKAFAKLELQGGETRSAVLRLGRDAAAFWDEEKGHWVVEKGRYEVWVGRSAADVRRKAAFEVKETFSWVF
ncbi:glycoside hydrolase family 3 protein, partial [Aplosporella prunicola CBS 121167]